MLQFSIFFKSDFCLYNFKYLIVVILSTFFVESYSQSYRSSEELINASFENSYLLIQANEYGNKEKPLLNKLLVVDLPPIYSDHRVSDYSDLQEKISQLKNKLSQLKSQLERSKDAAPKDAFETSDNYRQRLNLFEAKLGSICNNEINPMEIEIRQLMIKNYSSTDQSKLLYTLDPSLYNADKSAWIIPIKYESLSNNITIQVEPALAKKIWDNRSQISKFDITDIYGNKRYTKLEISDLNWSLYIVYDYKQNYYMAKMITNNSANTSTMKRGLHLVVGDDMLVPPKVDDETTLLNQKPISSNSNVIRVEIEAKFPGGDIAWSKYVQQILEKNIDKLTNEGISGTCEVQFIVDKDGNISDVEALSMRGTKLSEIAINAVKNGPKWEPATQNGRAVKAWRRQKITFRMPDDF